MATSSIFTNIKIDTPQKVDSFLNAYEASFDDSCNKKETAKTNAQFITNAKDIKSFYARVCKI